MYTKALILKYIHMTLITAITIWASTPENLEFANNKGADQPAHPCKLIRVFVNRFLGRSYLNLLQVKCQSVAEEIGLSLVLSQTPKTGFVASRPIQS